MTQVLDHGYVEYIDHCGSDEAIIEAARMSTARASKDGARRRSPATRSCSRTCTTTST